MAKLYEIVGEFKELLEMASEENMDQKLISDTLESIEFEFEEKADGYAKVVKMLEGDVEAIDKEIKRLTEKKNTIKNNISGIKKNLENAMLATGKTKFKTLLFGYGIQKIRRVCRLMMKHRFQRNIGLSKSRSWTRSRLRHT